MKITGKMSTFGGPKDTGMRPDEGLGLIEPYDLKNPRFSALFLPQQPDGTTGLGRRLDPSKPYIAMRWNYAEHSREFLRSITVTVSANGKSVEAYPVDWGPNQHTGRVADVSKYIEHVLGLKTDDTVTIEIPDAPQHCQCAHCA